MAQKHVNDSSQVETRNRPVRSPGVNHLPTLTPTIVGVAGASGSGKSTFCKQILEQLSKKKVETIPLDCFYFGLEEDDDPSEYNFDSPDSLDYQQCLQVIKGLKERKQVQVPVYDFGTHKPLPQKRIVEPADIILIEGIFVFHWKELRDLMDMKIYIYTDMDTCLVRRIRRDTVERDRTLESILTQYEKFVKPAFDEFIDKTKKYADMILPNNVNFSVGLECTVKKLESLV